MLNKYQNIYFLGIGGVGMSGLAGWCHEKQYYVSGYDRSHNKFTERLKHMGIVIHHDSSIEKLPKDKLDNTTTLIVYTPAIKKNHELYTYFNENNFVIVKRAELLQEISLKYDVIAIAGTHGKTTISIMLSHILRNSGCSPTAFFGGISKNYDTNFLIGDGRFMIVEADEYDKSFLKLNPFISVVTSMDKDHIDTYKSMNDMYESYYQFYLNTHKDNARDKEMFFAPISVVEKLKDHLIKRIQLGYNASTLETLDISVLDFSENKVFDNFMLTGMPQYNIRNALTAIRIASAIGISQSNIAKSFDNYQGVKRRFEYCVNTEKLILIDDYAHHPQELDALIKSLRFLYPKRKLFLIFQPHLFSRTRDLENDFCRVLSLVDSLCLLDIYPAREEPIEGVESKLLLPKIDLENKWHADFNSLQIILKQESPSLVVTAGAGDIYELIPKIKKILL